ncbi:MAG TPA: N-acetylmuramoyl-L-alanine amidase [Acidocella sp.]|jgi:N-acetylmuramoyl-L-alanine amidase|nr:N-acetylmuramoyl-L-alanine amidase [Acidocella sp.]
MAAAGFAATALPKPAQARLIKKNLPVVMIDPGHGGKDSGAIAPDGLYEKTITLATGHLLYRALSRTGRYRVEMTRSTDVYVTLEGRVAGAVAAKADLFLSLHCDHLPEENLRGASVFTLSSKASDRLAAGVAADENSADRFAGPHFSGVSPQVSSILASLETRATRIGSATLADDIQRSFTGVVPMLPDPHRSANFAVLRDPSVPSALLEMGCLSNPLDERLLKSAAHRQVIADKLTTSIDAYFANYAGGRGIRMAG